MPLHLESDFVPHWLCSHELRQVTGGIKCIPIPKLDLENHLPKPFSSISFWLFPVAFLTVLRLLAFNLLHTVYLQIHHFLALSIKKLSTRGGNNMMVAYHRGNSASSFTSNHHESSHDGIISLLSSFWTFQSHRILVTWTIPISGRLRAYWAMGPLGKSPFPSKLVSELGSSFFSDVFHSFSARPFPIAFSTHFP